MTGFTHSPERLLSHNTLGFNLAEIAIVILKKVLHYKFLYDTLALLQARFRRSFV